MLLSNPSDPAVPISSYLAEAIMLAQDIIKNPLANGSAVVQVTKQNGPSTYVETIKYTVDHDALIKLANGEADVSQLPKIHVTVTNDIKPAGAAPTGAMSITMGYSGEINKAHAAVGGDQAFDPVKLSPADAFIIVKEAVDAVKATNAKTPTA